MLNRLRICLYLVAIVTALLQSGKTPAAEPSVNDFRERCDSLRNSYLDIIDAPTMLTRSGVVSTLDELYQARDPGPNEREMIRAMEQGAAKHIGAIKPYCRVTGYVVPNVGFELLLPLTNWNHKFLHLGCAGWCGSTKYVGLECATHPGYACIGTDMGHSGSGGVWLRDNLQAQIDFSYRATHVATLAGKAIIERYYGTRAQRAYFMGASTGGYQGMVEAQRYPWDFDGIIAGAPDMDESDLAVHDIWMERNSIGADGKPLLSPEDLQLLHRAALEKCDMDDGVRDGIISDPLHCKFDPGELVCKTVKSSGCLSAEQVQAVKNIYGAPVTSSGKQLLSRGVFPGSEIDWSFTGKYWGQEYFQEGALLGAGWKPSDFDFDRDYPRSGSGVLFPDTNPDLRKFKATGGKLLVYQGANDTAEYPPALLDYYDTAERTMGGRAATQDFFRLFLVPGMLHGSGGDGPYAIDYLSYMEAWVEQGKPPDMMIGTHPEGLQPGEEFLLKFPLDPDIHVGFTRPLYPYPLYARYRGKGDPTKAENFRPVSPE